MNISELNRPIYGNKSNMPVFGEKSNMPLYGALLSDFNIMTEWRFVQNYPINGYVSAYINDVVVCRGHSTTHIVDYNIYTLGSELEWSDEKQAFYLDFSMGIKPIDGYEDKPFGGSCVFRAWIKGHDEISVEQDGQMGDTKWFRLYYRPKKTVENGRFEFEVIIGN